MKVEIVSRKLVKLLVPTPQDLKNYNISYMDELNPAMNVIVILYYQQVNDLNEKVKHLEQSLAKILSKFYPFAGRYVKKDHVVECSDQGALLLQAQASDLELVQLIEPDSKITPEELNDLLPCDVFEADEETDPILSIQITSFKCGGISIGISISYRVIDACCLEIFISAWSKACLGQGNINNNICPVFNGPNFFPGRNFSPPQFDETDPTIKNDSERVVTRRFIFDKYAISRIREYSINNISKSKREPSSPVLRLSRVQLVFGLILKAITCVDRRDLLVAQDVNMRERTKLPLISKHSIGNLAALSITELAADETRDVGFEEFARVLSRDVRKAVQDCARADFDGFLVDPCLYVYEKLSGHDVNVVWATDWTKFGFYEADFGWGKPVWTSVANMQMKNHVCLMSDKEGGGVEAWVQFKESQMALFTHQLEEIISRV